MAPPPSPLRAPLAALLASLDEVARHARRTIGVRWTPTGMHLTQKSRSPYSNGFDASFSLDTSSAHARLAMAPLLQSIRDHAMEAMERVFERPVLASALWNTKAHPKNMVDWGVAVRGERTGQGKARVLLGYHLHTPAGAHGVDPAALLDAFDAAWHAASDPNGGPLPCPSGSAGHRTSAQTAHTYGVAPFASAPGQAIHGPLAGNAGIWHALAPLVFSGPAKVFRSQGTIDTLSIDKPSHVDAARRIAQAADAVHTIPHDPAQGALALRGVWTRQPDGTITTEALANVPSAEDAAIRHLLDTMVAEVPHLAATTLSYWNGHPTYVAAGGQRFATPEKLACLAGVAPSKPDSPTWALCQPGASLILYAAPFASRGDAAQALWALHDKGVGRAHLWEEIPPLAPSEALV